MSMHITMRQLQVFESVARHLSFTRAAQELHLTQPAVSMKIKQLEAMIELPLFEQLGKKVHLTEAGQTMLHHSRIMMSDLTDINRDLDRLKGVEGGNLKLCIATSVNYFATRLLAKFCGKYKSINIILDVTNRDDLRQRLAINQPDLVLMGQPSRDMNVIAKAFMQTPLIVIANPKHRLAKRREIQIEELNNETMIMREPGSNTRTTMQQMFDKRGIKITPGMQLSSVEAIKQSVEAGFGLAVVSAHTVELELNASRLVKLDFQHFPLMQKWYIAHRKGKRLSQPAMAFYEFILEEGEKQREL